jgi:hypothetical protein
VKRHQKRRIDSLIPAAVIPDARLLDVGVEEVGLIKGRAKCQP